MPQTKLEKAFAALGAAWLLVAAAPAAAQISLGSAHTFGVLGGSAVTNTGGTIVNGDVGVSPGSAITGFPPGTVAGGTLHSADAVAQQAQTDLTTAYDEIVATPCLVDLTGQNLGGLTLSPGVYCFDNSAQLTGALTLDALGNPNALFVFKIGSTLTTSSGSTVTVINGGSPCNRLYWQVGSSATLGTATSFAGDILALTSITLTTGASSAGRILARNGAVTLDTNVVNSCPAVAACPAITVNPATLPAGEIGVLYSQVVSASGGTAPYTFSISSGALPDGLTLDGATGALGGIPTESGSFSFSITATDAAGCLGTRFYKMTIAAAGCLPITLDPVALPPGRVLEPYAEAVTASGGVPPYTYTVASGALPPGLLLDPATGLISGIPAVSGSFSFTIEAMDAEGCLGSRDYSLTILEVEIEIQEIPTLGTASLIALAALLGVVALGTLRRF